MSGPLVSAFAQTTPGARGRGGKGVTVTSSTIDLTMVQQPPHSGTAPTRLTMARGSARHTLGQASKGARQASMRSDADMPPAGSHAVRALGPSVVSTKQSVQQLEFLDGHVEKQLALRSSIAA